MTTIDEWEARLIDERARMIDMEIQPWRYPRVGRIPPPLPTCGSCEGGWHWSEIGTTVMVRRCACQSVGSTPRG